MERGLPLLNRLKPIAMKKMILFASLTSLLMLGSCRKDWVCHCTDQSGDTENFDQHNQTLSEARSECKGRNYDQTTLGIHTSLDCSLQ